MGIVAATSSWLALTHLGALMTSEEFVLRRKVWGQGVADSARINETVIQCQSRYEWWRVSLYQYIYISGLVILLLLPAFSIPMSFNMPEPQTRLRTSVGWTG